MLVFLLYFCLPELIGNHKNSGSDQPETALHDVAGGGIIRQILTKTTPSPFLFTAHIRPVSQAVEEQLREGGAKLFAKLWSSHSSSAISNQLGLQRSPVCDYPPVWRTGPGCEARIPQWTFNSSSGLCQSYWYGGCGASENLFSNEDKCRLTCPHDPSGIIL